MPISRTIPAVVLAAVALAGCGSSSPKSATGLAYTDPPSTTGWRLVRSASSTPDRLVLELVGPHGLMTRGAAFNLAAPPAVHFLRFDSTGFPVEDAGVYELLNTAPWDAPDPLEPRLLAGGVKSGNVLTVGVFQKDRRATAKESGRPLFRIALELDPSAKSMAGDKLPLSIVKARFMAEDVGAFSVDPTIEMAQKAHLVDMPVSIGELHAN
jgi:hypothetical protein